MLWAFLGWACVFLVQGYSWDGIVVMKQPQWLIWGSWWSRHLQTAWLNLVSLALPPVPGVAILAGQLLCHWSGTGCYWETAELCDLWWKIWCPVNCRLTVTWQAFSLHCSHFGVPKKPFANNSGKSQPIWTKCGTHVQSKVRQRFGNLGMIVKLRQNGLSFCPLY